MDKVMIDEVDVSECGYCLNNQLKGKGHAPAKSMPYAKETSCIACKEDITRLNFCKNNPNCYYKQLKRKEQECEKLKWLLETKCQSEWEKENAELKAENEKLKIDIGIYKGIIDADKEENERLKEELRTEKIYSSQIEELEESLQHAKAENERLKLSERDLSRICQGFKKDIETEKSYTLKYYKALQEIRDIAEKEIVCDNCNFEGTDKCDARMCTHFYLNDFSKDILAKINEVIGAEQIG